MDLGGLMSGLAQMLTWPAPLRLRPLAEADVDPLASLIVTILGEFEFEWLATKSTRRPRAKPTELAMLTGSRPVSSTRIIWSVTTS